MATQIQFRRGTTAGHSAFTGAAGELTIDTDKDTIIVHDGSTTGGANEMVTLSNTQTLTNKTLTSATLNTPTISGDVTFSDGAFDFDIASHDGTNGLALGGTVVTASAAELNTLDGITASTAELNLMDGVTATTTELNYLDITTLGTSQASAAVTTDSSNNCALGNNLTVGGNATITGNLTVNGTTTTVATSNSTITDGLIELGNGTTGTPSNDTGIVIERGDSNNAFIGFDESADKFTVGTGTFTGASTGNLTITTGTMVANIEGNVTGNVTGNLTGDVTGNANTATTLETARTIGGVSFNGSANINLPGVNTSGNQDTSGNAATASALETSRTISLTGDVTGSVSFDGSANASITTTVAANSVALGTDTTGNYMVNVSAGAGIDVSHTQGEGSTATITIESDLRGDVTQIGQDTNDYYSIGATAHNWYLDGANDMRLENDGDLHVDGDLIAYSTTVSDERLKTNIQVIDNALEKVNSLRGVTFHYTMDGRDAAGLIAQEVEKVLPSAIRNKKLSLKQDDGIEYKTLQYDQTIGLLVEAIKELSVKVDELENK